MKYTLLLLFAVLSIHAAAQMNGNYNYTIAVKGFSVMQMPKIFNQSTQNYINSYFNGGTLRFNDNQISFRLTGGYLQRSISFPGDCGNCDLASGKIKDYAFKAGFEKNFNYSRIQPYFAFDLGYRYNRFKGITSTLNAKKDVTSSNYAESTKDGLTAAPVIGLRINILDQLSFYAESNPEFFYSNTREETTSQGLLNSRSLNKYSKGEFLFNPITLGIQLHLGNSN